MNIKVWENGKADNRRKLRLGALERGQFTATFHSIIYSLQQNLHPDFSKSFLIDGISLMEDKTGAVYVFQMLTHAGQSSTAAFTSAC